MYLKCVAVKPSRPTCHERWINELECEMSEWDSYYDTISNKRQIFQYKFSIVQFCSLTFCLKVESSKRTDCVRIPRKHISRFLQLYRG